MDRSAHTLRARSTAGRLSSPRASACRLQRRHVVQELIPVADVGLYLSKASGRNRTSIGEPSEVRQALGGGNGTQRAPAFHQAAADDESQSA